MLPSEARAGGLVGPACYPAALSVVGRVWQLFFLIFKFFFSSVVLHEFVCVRIFLVFKNTKRKRFFFWFVCFVFGGPSSFPSYSLAFPRVNGHVYFLTALQSDTCPLISVKLHTGVGQGLDLWRESQGQQDN